MKANKVLVLGASGNVGRNLVKALQARGELVRAGSRSGAPVEGAEGVAFDFTDPATYAPALDGVDRAYLMWPAGLVPSQELLTQVVGAMASRNIKIVLQSVIGVNADDSIPLRQVELAVERSGARFVILRPNWFSDNFHNYWKHDIAQGRIAVPAEEGKSSFIDVRDIADSAAAALTSSEFDGKAFDLTGPEALSYSDAAVVLTRVLGKPVSYLHVNDEDFVKNLVDAGLREDYARFLASIFYPVREGWTAVVTDHVRQLTGRAPYALTDYAQHHLHTSLAN